MMPTVIPSRLRIIFLLFAFSIVLMLPLEPAHSSNQQSLALPSMSLVSIAYDGSQTDSHSSQPAITPDGYFVAFKSYATNLIPEGGNLSSIYVRDLQNDTNELISLTTSNGQGMGDHPDISADGRFVVFDSLSSNLVPGDSNNSFDVFLRDRETHQTERISISSNEDQSNAHSFNPVISADGRFVAFHSKASNLVPGDTNNVEDVFVRDRYAGTTERVSIASDSTQGNNASCYADISPDGRYVVFESTASNLVPGDTSSSDIFFYDRDMDTIERLSISTEGVAGNNNSHLPRLSGGGRFIVFESFANNLAPNDTNYFISDVFLRDRQNGTTELISSALTGYSGNDGSYFSSVSDDGRWITFHSRADDLVEDDTNSRVDVFLRDRDSGQTELVSVSYSGTLANNASNQPRITGTGNLVVYFSSASNLVENDTNGVDDIFLRELGSVSDQLAIKHIEVTQVIQDESNLIPLVAGKPSLVRVYVDCSLYCNMQQPITTTGSLLVSGPSGYSLNLTQNNPIVAANPSHWSEQRGELGNTLNFLLPINMPAGTYGLTAQIEGFQLTETITFTQMSTLSIGYIPIRYGGAAPDPNRISGSNGISQWASKVNPVSRLFYYPAGPTIDWNRCLENHSPSCQTLNEDQVEELRVYLLNELTTLYRFIDPSILLFGWLRDGTLSGGFSLPPTANGGSGRVAFGDDNPAYGKQIFAHEIAHLLGRPHTKATSEPVNDCANVTPFYWSDWPYQTAYIQDWGIDVMGLFGTTLVNYPLFAPAAARDYMSYCWENVPVWTSPHTYNKLYDTMRSQSTTSVLLSPGANNLYMISSGLVYTDNTAVLDPTWLISSTVPLENPPSGTQYCLEAQDGSGVALDSQCFDLTFIIHDTDSPSYVDGFSLILPYFQEINRIVLKKGALELAHHEVSPHAPEVNISLPNGGEIWSAGETYTITWSATDLDGDLLSYRVFYGNGGTWMPIGTAITETQITVNAAELAGSDGARIKVLASDGLNNSFDESDSTFVVEKKYPQVSILSPESGGTIQSDHFLYLVGYAFDWEDGMLDESTYFWSSSIDGALGIGSQVLASLSPGHHTLSLTVTDSDGNTTTDTILVFVGKSLYLPYLHR